MRFGTRVRGFSALACLVWSLGAVALAGPVLADEVRVLLLETRQTLAVGSARVAPVGGSGGRLKVDGQLRGPRWEAPGSGPHQVGDHHVRGRVEVERTRDGLRVINRVPLEAYVAGTLGAEMYARWEPAALQAQAVASRTYALYQQRRRRTEPYDVGTSTRDQVYRGLAAETPEIREAVAGTRGEVLLWKGEPILAAFHSASGGQTASAAEVWGRAVPYLRSRAVADEDASPHTYWRARIPRTKLGPALAPLGLDLGAIRTLRVVGRTPSGRVARVELVGSQGSERVTARALRTVLGASVLRSTLFEIRETNDAVSFVGSGHGHGVGMSQWGAQAMAERGAGYREILSTFYPGTTLARRNPVNWTEPISLGFVPLQAAAEPSPFSMLVPMGMIFLIFYFLLIRPQQKRQKEQDEMLKAIEKGDSVVTLGGLHGKVVGVTDDVLTLEIATLKGGERIRVKAARMKVDTVQKAKKGEDS